MLLHPTLSIIPSPEMSSYTLMSSWSEMGERFLLHGRQGLEYGKWEWRGRGVGTGERQEDPEDCREVVGEELEEVL